MSRRPGPRTGRRRLLAGLAALGAGLGLAVAVAPAAFARAQIIGSDPVDGTNLSASPRTLTLTMSEAVELRYTRLAVTDGLGRSTPLTGLRLDPAAAATSGVAPAGEGTERPVAVTATLPVLAPDLYRVTWSTLSSDDLHTSSGVVVFGVQHAVVARPAAVPDPPPGPAEVALRWAGLIGMGTAAGAAILCLLLPGIRAAGDPVSASRELPAARRRLVMLAGLAAGGGALAELALLFIQAHAVGAGWLAPAGHVLAGGYGVRWAGREGSALAVAALAALVVRRPAGEGPAPARGPDRFAVGIAVLGLVYALAVTLTGHGGATARGHPARVLVETVHVAAAGAWVGTMVAALLVLWRPGPVRAPGHPVARQVARAALRRAVLARFGAIAASCLALMTATGVILAGSRVASVDAALTSAYGRILLVKVALVTGALVSAAVTAATVHPGLVPARRWPAVSGLRLRRVLAVEALAALSVLLAAAALGSAQPANGPGWRPAPAAAPLRSATAADLVETLRVAPNRPGRNFLSLDVYDSRRPAPAPIGAVVVTVAGGDGRSVTATAARQGDGRWLLATDAFSAPGHWTVRADVSRPGYPVSSQSYDWVVATPAGAGRAVVVSSRPLAPILDRVAGGLVAVLAVVGLVLVQIRGRRRAITAPPSGAAPAVTEPSNAVATAATSASPSPVPGSSPTA